MQYDLFSSQDLLNDLNPPQREAVEHFEGPILVLAGAGSGKTRVLTRRVANLVLHHGVSPQSILAVTFTNKATEEMRERLRSLLGHRAEELWVATFHSAALRMLRRHAHLLGYTNDFIVYDEGDIKSLLKGILKELSIDEKSYPTHYFSRIIDGAKNNFILPDTFKGKSFAPYENSMQEEVYTLYQRELIKANAMDFGDLLVNGVRLLQIPDILKLYQRHVEFVLVDEYQDTNEVQYLFIRLLVTPRNNLLVVGDDDQSIYAFRGATIRNILEFERDFRGAKVVKLEQNYRSTGNILKASHGVIEKNTGRKEKKLWTSGVDGEKIRTYVGSSETEEAQFIAQEITRRTAAHAPTLEKVSLREIAIFYRTNAQSRAIEEALIQRKIPYRIFGGLKFYERKEVKDILAYLRIVVSEADNQAFLRTVNTPPRGIGAQMLQAIEDCAKRELSSLFQGAVALVAQNPGGRIKGVEEFIALIGELRGAAKTRTLGELIEYVVTRTEYAKKLEASKDPNAQSRIENLRELQSLARSSENASLSPFENVKAFLDRVSLTASADAPTSERNDGGGGGTQEQSGAVSLMTLHLAKGLEFDLVFLTGVEEGLIPHYRSLDDPLAIEEERRLCYVGITRAKKQLFLTRAEMRGMFSSGDSFGSGGMYREPSRFVDDIPTECIAEMGKPFGAGGGSWEESDDLDISEETHSSLSHYQRGVSSQRAAYPQGRFGAHGGVRGSGRTRRAPTLTFATQDKGGPKSISAQKPPPGSALATKESLVSGVKVHHTVFGEGIVEKLSEEGVDSEVFVQFKNFEGTKKLILKYAKLWVVP